MTEQWVLESLRVEVFGGMMYRSYEAENYFFIEGEPPIGEIQELAEDICSQLGEIHYRELHKGVSKQYKERYVSKAIVEMLEEGNWTVDEKGYIKEQKAG